MNADSETKWVRRVIYGLVGLWCVSLAVGVFTSARAMPESVERDAFEIGTACVVTTQPESGCE